MVLAAAWKYKGAGGKGGHKGKSKREMKKDDFFGRLRQRKAEAEAKRYHSMGSGNGFWWNTW